MTHTKPIMYSLDSQQFQLCYKVKGPYKDYTTQTLFSKVQEAI